MYGPYAPMMDGLNWIWQMGPVWTLLLLMVVGLALFGLVTTTRRSKPVATSDVK